MRLRGGSSFAWPAFQPLKNPLSTQSKPFHCRLARRRRRWERREPGDAIPCPSGLSWCGDGWRIADCGRYFYLVRHRFFSVFARSEEIQSSRRLNHSAITAESLAICFSLSSSISHQRVTSGREIDALQMHLVWWRIPPFERLFKPPLNSWRYGGEGCDRKLAPARSGNRCRFSCRRGQESGWTSGRTTGRPIDYQGACFCSFDGSS